MSEQPLIVDPNVQRIMSQELLNERAPVDGVELEYRRLFNSLSPDVGGCVPRDELFVKLRDAGISADDPRIRETVQSLEALDKNHKFTFTEFHELARRNSSLIKKAIQDTLIVPDFPLLVSELKEIYRKVEANKSGQVASYIPQLSRVNPDQFAVSICTVDGQRFSLGDSEVDFCLQSVSKPINYCLALEEHGEALVHKHVGREPSGRGFNELTLNKEGLPHNPLINSGAIMSCSLVKPHLDIADRFDWVSNAWIRLTGKSRIGFNNPVYLSEKQTADRNFALGYFMRENRAFPEGTDLVQNLEFYFQCCSIELNAQALAVAAGSLANGGVCPLTGDKIFKPKTVQNCLSLMSTCGMYDFSGEFAFTIGLPAKSGVSGVLMLVVPGVMGICIWSPRLDPLGNSVRGVEFCKELVNRYNFHTFDGLNSSLTSKRDPRLKKNQSRIEGVVNLCWAASQGDLNEVQKLSATGVDLDGADYDGRTALHLAASEGHEHIVQYLVLKGVDLKPLDRWGGTPLTDAQRGNFESVVRILREAERASQVERNN